MKRVIFLIASSVLGASDEFFEAARKGDLATLKAELDKGIDVNSKWRYDQTALFIAARRGHTEVVKLLLDRGAAATAKDSFYGMNALGSAAAQGHAEVLRMLIAKGAEGREEALVTASGSGKLDVVKVLLEPGGLKPDILTKALSAARKHPDVVAQLKQAGAVEIVTVKLDPAVLARYAGLYRTEKGQELKFDVLDGKLIATLEGQKQEYLPIDEKTFLPVGLEHLFKVVFLIEGDKVAAFDFHEGGNVHRANRVEGK